MSSVLPFARLARGLTFHAAIIRVLIVRVVAGAGDGGIEALPSGGEIDKSGERAGCLMREMKAATGRACAAAEWRAPVR